MAVGHEYIRPAVVVEIEKAYSPSEILRVHAQPGLVDRVIKSAVAVVMVQIRSLVGVVCLDDVEPAVAVVVADSHAHPALRRSVLIDRATDLGADLFERPIVIVVVETAWNGVARYINVGPAIVVKVRRTDAKSVRAHRNPLLVDRCRRRQAARDRHAGSLGNILKCSIAAIVIQDVRPAAEPLRPAPDRKSVV